MKRHPLEREWKTSATNILSAIQHGFRAQVDVKGKLAEHFLNQHLRSLKKTGVIGDFDWRDKDGIPDFGVLFRSRTLQIECKNVRSGDRTIFKNPPGFKVELQKTRNSKDGTPTRGYKTSEFDVLAACLFNQTRKWKYLFIATKHLECRQGSPDFLEIMQRVPFKPEGKWRIRLQEALIDAVSTKRT